VPDTVVYLIVEEMPEFPGGMAATEDFISQNLRYPAKAKENGIQGRVTAKFVVKKDGTVVGIQILKGVDPILDKEAIRVIGAMPKWKPGEQDGKPVNVWFTLPINFTLQKPK
jgi:protein TonB